MSITGEDVNTIASGGGEVRTSSGDKVGKVGQVYLDDETGQPSWVTVRTGLFGTQESFVPLADADLDGVDVLVPYDKETIKGAPRLDSDGSLTPQEEKQLYSYYFTAPTLPGTDERRQSSRGEGVSAVAARGGDSDHLRDDSRDRDVDDDGIRDHDRDGDRDRDGVPGNDAGAENAGTARLRKYVVTEKVIPVSREEMPGEDSTRG